jgi:hypothetical protein
LSFYFFCLLQGRHQSRYQLAFGHRLDSPKNKDRTVKNILFFWTGHALLIVSDSAHDLLESTLFGFYFLLLRSKQVIGNENSINFLLDTWHNDYLLSIKFSLVYAKTKSFLVSLNDVWNMNNIKLNLTLGVSLAMRQEKTQFLAILNSLTFTLNKNFVVWLWKPTSVYTNKSLYIFLCFGGITI